jgi:hypothetical protein
MNRDRMMRCDRYIKPWAVAPGHERLQLRDAERDARLDKTGILRVARGIRKGFASLSPNSILPDVIKRFNLEAGSAMLGRGNSNALGELHRGSNRFLGALPKKVWTFVWTFVGHVHLGTRLDMFVWTFLRPFTTPQHVSKRSTRRAVHNRRTIGGTLQRRCVV